MRKEFYSLVFCCCFSAAAFAQPTVEFKNFNMANTPVFAGNNFKAVGVGKGNRIWAGTQYQGLYWWDTARKDWTSTGLFNNLFINHIISDKFGGIWIGQSGTSGSTGGASNVAGGINYFADTTNQYQFFSTNQFLPSRNVRSIYLDEKNVSNNGSRKLWATMGTYITSSKTAAGGIVSGQDFNTGNFQKVWEGLQIQPNTNVASAGTPSCYGLCSDGIEVWVGAETNYTPPVGGASQILKYDAVTGKFLGGWDPVGEFDNARKVYKDEARNYVNISSHGVLLAGFRTTAMHVDDEGRRWVGLRSGGVAVKMGNQWIKVNMPGLFPAGTMVNFNAIANDEFGNVYIGTSSGLVVFQNGGDPGLEEDYKRYTITEGLPSNNITGMAYDKSVSRMILATDAGISFMSLAYKIDVKQIWDYSFPDREGNPVGVVADGVSRVYLKIKKAKDAVSNVKAVNLKIKDYEEDRPMMFGKFKKALVINGYSEEANDAAASEITVTSDDIRAGAPGEFWIWYVSPEDFSFDSVSTNAQRRRRYETIEVEVTYENNEKDVMDYEISIVRPPTVFVHGLASDPSCWDNLNHYYNNTGSFVPFVKSPLFTYSNALKMEPGGFFRKNAIQLLAGDISFRNSGADQFNTLQGNIEAIRKMKYAANQVDYVCHSMGGIMIREAIGIFKRKFTAGINDPYVYKTYGQGFTHKIITVNTPHNSSPVADAVDQFVPFAPPALRYVLDGIYTYGKSAIGFDVPSFFLPDGNTILGKYKASEAVDNLQITDVEGGINLLETPYRYHMITGDLDWDFVSEMEDGAGAVLTKIFKVLLELTYATTYELQEFSPEQAVKARVKLREFMGQEPKLMIKNYWDWYSGHKGFPNFFADGDGIVPLASQTARESLSQTYISNFKNTDLFANPFFPPGINSHHIIILTRNDVGQKILALLNSRKSSSLFGDKIPANIDREPGSWESRPLAKKPVSPSTTLAVYGSFFDTTKVKIDSPATGNTVYSDSVISIKYRIKDTTRLAYVSIHFQGADSIRVSKTFAQQSIPVKVNPAFLAENKIYVTAAYDRATNDGVDYYTDSLSVTAENLATLQGFRVTKDVEDLRAGENHTMHYEAKYNDVWVPLATTDPNIRVKIDSASILAYDSATAYFNGIKKGVALTGFTYKGFSDEVLFRVIMPYNANCINQTVATGNFSNPVTWSKGVVPDICDSVIISPGHTITLDASVTIRALRISSGATLIINSAAHTLQLGQQDEGFAIADNYGNLTISKGKLSVNGRLKLNSASSFNMTGGSIVIDGNSNNKETSIDDGAYLFDVASDMQSFNFSGDTLQLIDPPFGGISQAISCNYNFGINSTLILGNGISLDKSNNSNGFGGSQFPPQIGKLVLDTKETTGNRQLIITKPLNVKGRFEVRTGSNLKIQAEVRVTQ